MQINEFYENISLMMMKRISMILYRYITHSKIVRLTIEIMDSRANQMTHMRRVDNININGGL